MKTFYFSFIIMICLPIFSFGQLQQIELDKATPGMHLQSLIIEYQIEEIALVRPFGKNKDTTLYTFESEKFIFSNKMLMIDEELIYLDSITGFSLMKNVNKSRLLLRTKDKIRHYYPHLKNNLESLLIFEKGSSDHYMNNGILLQKHELLNKPAPAVNSKTLSGERFDLEQLKGKIVLLNFWFLGCINCRKEFPDFNKLKTNYPAIEIISVALDKEEALLKFVDIQSKGNYKLNEPYNYFGNEILFEIIPNGEKIVDAYSFVGFPKNFFIDRQGIIRSFSGAVNYENLEKQVLELLK